MATAGHGHEGGFIEKLVIGAFWTVVLLAAIGFFGSWIFGKCERHGWKWCEVVYETPQQSPREFRGTVPPAQRSPHSSWPEPTQTVRPDGRGTVTTTVTPVPKMTAAECKTKYGGTWEPSSTGGPNICRQKK